MSTISINNYQNLGSIPRWPTYLRIVVNAVCPLSCSFCHMEGDPGEGKFRSGLSLQELCDYLDVAVLMGVKKFKFLGGEPLVRKDLPAVVAHLHGKLPDADISLITSGAANPAHLRDALAQGLSRANMSIHGWTPQAFAVNGGRERHFQMRQENLELLFALGRPLKLNYVYTGPQVLQDLGEFLRWAADKPVVVNVLDDLGQPDLGAQDLYRVLRELCGAWSTMISVPDPHSLSTTHLLWDNGLRVEIKTEQLGLMSPWLDCQACPVRSRCREGIFALRLTHQGKLRLCMDREDIELSLRSIREQEPAALPRAWYEFVHAHLRSANTTTPPCSNISPFPMISGKEAA